MKRMIIYALILGALWFAPLDRIEIANLEPVEAVWMYLENGNVVLETDTEDKGTGATAEEALADMKENSTGIIYLDTARYLFLGEGGRDRIGELSEWLKRSVRLCEWDGIGSLKEVVKYADAHKIGEKIQSWKRSGKLPNLSGRNLSEKGEMPY